MDRNIKPTLGRTEPDLLLFSNTVDHIVMTVTGVLVSLYALHVELQKERNSDYVAYCDIHKTASCTRVLTSEYGKGFGLLQYVVGKDSRWNIRNCTVGILFFILQLVIGLLPISWGPGFLFYTSVVTCVGCVYLCYILFVILKDICVVCITTYCINFSLLYLNHARLLAE